MTRLDGFELRVRPGQGLAARFGDVAVYVRDQEAGEAVERLLDTCRALGAVRGPFPGDALVARLRSGSVLGVVELSFCVVAPLTGGLELVAQGDVEVAIDRHGAVTRHLGHDPGRWIDLVVDDGFDSLTVRPTEGPRRAAALPVAPEGQELTSAVVAAGEVTLARAGAQAEPTEPAEGEPAARVPEEGWDGLVRAVLAPDDERVAGAVDAVVAATSPEPVIEAVVLVGPAAGPVGVPLPVGVVPEAVIGPRVAALRCPAGHASPPAAAWCITCGRTLSGPGVARVEAVRPSLGLLVADDGAVFALDAGYVIGSDPLTAAAVRDGAMRPLVVRDDAGSVAQAHAEIRLAGWEVLAVDLGSAAGTGVVPPGSHRRHHLTPDLPEPLSPGSRVIVGPAALAFVGRPVRRPRAV